jgi:hypothetical protein
MSSKKPIPATGSYYMSPEECQEMFRDFNSGPWAADVIRNSLNPAKVIPAHA